MKFVLENGLLCSDDGNLKIRVSMISILAYNEDNDEIMVRVDGSEWNGIVSAENTRRLYSQISHEMKVINEY